MTTNVEIAQEAFSKLIAFIAERLETERAQATMAAFPDKAAKLLGYFEQLRSCSLGMLSLAVKTGYLEEAYIREGLLAKVAELFPLEEDEERYALDLVEVVREALG